MKNPNQTERDEAEALFRQGRELYERAYFSSAIKELEKSLQRDPEHALAEELLRKARRWHEVEKSRELEAVLVQLRNRVEALSYPEVNLVQETLQELELALRIEPSHEELQQLHKKTLEVRLKISKFLEAERRVSLGDLDGGISLLQSLEEPGGGFGKSSARLAELQTLREEMSQSYLKAQNFLVAEDFAEARACLEGIEARCPGFRDISFLLKQLEQREKAQALLEQAQELERDGLLPEAFQLLQGLQAQLPDHTEVIRRKGLLGRQLAQKKFELANRFLESEMDREALQLTREALVFDPHHEEALLQVAVLERKLQSASPPPAAPGKPLVGVDSPKNSRPAELLQALNSLDKISQEGRERLEAGDLTGAAAILQKQTGKDASKKASGDRSRSAWWTNRPEGRGLARDGVLLTIRYGKGIDKYVLLMKDRISIGRHESNDIILEDISTSRHHALIRFEQGQFVIEDLGSKNGTFIAGRQVVDTVLNSGDVIDFGGDSRLLFHTPEDSNGSSELRAKGARLTLSVAGKRDIHYLLQQKQILLGQSQECQVRIQEEGVAPRHASIRFEEQAFLLEPLSQGARTLLRGQWLASACRISFGDLVHLGEAELYFLDYHY